jgi:hypothetical protein
MPTRPKMRERCMMCLVYREGGDLGVRDCDRRHALPAEPEKPTYSAFSTVSNSSRQTVVNAML